MHCALKKGERMRKSAAVIISVLGVMVLMIFPQAAAEGIAGGLESAAKLLIPSLFPFMVMSSFIIRSGAYEWFGKVLAPVTKIFFGLPAAASSAVILSFIGGFPIGAKCTKLLYQNGKITNRQAERMLCFCVCSGPAFLVTAIGTIMLHSITAGIILYLSQIVSGILLGIISRWICRSQQEETNVSDTEHEKESSILQAFILSCSDGAKAIIELTALVAMFAMLIRILSVLGMENTFITLLLEVTTACKNIVNAGYPLWLLALATGYGGLCVHFQIFHLLKEMNVNKIRFELFRIANAVVAAVITYLICLFVNPTAATFAVSGNTNAEITSGSLAGAAALVIMSGIFLLSLKQNRFD